VRSGAPITRYASELVRNLLTPVFRHRLVFLIFTSNSIAHHARRQDVGECGGENRCPGQFVLVPEVVDVRLVYVDLLVRQRVESWSPETTKFDVHPRPVGVSKHANDGSLGESKSGFGVIELHEPTDGSRE